jgi:hypothetical protein
MKKSFNNILPYLFAFFIFFVSVVRAEDDDDDDAIGEIVTDLLVGAALEVCSMHATCHFIMMIFGFLAFIIVVIGMCSGKISYDEIFNYRNARCGATIGAGRGIVRSWR